MKDHVQIHTTQKQLHHQTTTSERQEAAMVKEAELEIDIVQDPIENFKLRCLAKGVTGVLDFGRLVRHRDYATDHTFTLEDVTSLMNSASLDMPDGKIQDLFNVLGGKETGRIHVDSLITAARSHMSLGRLRVIREAFNQLDQSGQGVVTEKDISRGLCVEHHPRYKVGEETKEEIVLKFVGHFKKEGEDADISVTEEDFVNYYAGISPTIDDDTYFDLMMRQSYGLEHSTERLFHVTASSHREGELVNSSLTEVDSATDPLAKLRSHCLGKGTSGILQLGRLFRRTLADPCQKFGLEEFSACLTKAFSEMSTDEIEALFEVFKDQDGLVGVSSLMSALRPPVSVERRYLIAGAFKKLDRSGKGILSAGDFERGICLDHHPRYLVGEETRKEIADKLLERFHSPGWDKTVTEEEFLDFYSAVSSTIDNDGFFDLMMRQSFKL